MTLSSTTTNLLCAIPVCWPCSSNLPRPNADLIVNRAVSHRVLLTVPFQFVDHSHSDVMPTATEDFSGVWPHLHICNGIDAITHSVLLACIPAQSGWDHAVAKSSSVKSESLLFPT